MRASRRPWRPFRRTALLLCLLLTTISAAGRGPGPPASPTRPAAPHTRPGAGRCCRTSPTWCGSSGSGCQQSGLTHDQVRARLRAAGYPENILDQYLSGADTSHDGAPRSAHARRRHGARHPLTAGAGFAPARGLHRSRCRTRCGRCSTRCGYLHLDSLRADSLADSLEAIRPGGLKLFGIETFRRLSTQFEPMDAGPVDENYRLGPGDALVLILTGDVEQAHLLEVTREGFVVIPAGGAALRREPHDGPAAGPALRPAGQGVLRRAPEPQRAHQVPALPGEAPQDPGLRGGRRGPARRLPDLEPPGTVLNALYAAGRPDHQRQLPPGRRPPGRAAGGQRGRLRLPARSGINPTGRHGSRPATWCSCRCTAAWPRSPAR